MGLKTGIFVPAWGSKVLLVLCLANVLNYVDRGALSGMLPILDQEFQDTKFEDGVLGGSFMVSYAVCCVAFAYLSERFNAFALISMGMVTWIISAVMGGFAVGPRTLIAARVFSGTAEGSLQAIGPTLLQDLSKKSGRTDGGTLWLTVFFVCQNAGVALGNILAGLAGQQWRWVFRGEAMSMLPVLGALLYFVWVTREKYHHDGRSSPSNGRPQESLENPFIGGHHGMNINSTTTTTEEEEKQQQQRPTRGERPLLALSKGTIEFVQRFKRLFTNPTWCLLALGYGAFTFGNGALTFWMSEFCTQVYPSLSLKSVDMSVGLTVALAGVVGTYFGGILLKMAGPSVFNSCVLSAVEVTVGSMIVTSAIAASTTLSYGGFLAIFGLGGACMFLTTSPVNLALLESVHPDDRSLSMAMSIVVMHLVGDMPSPMISGLLWDRAGNPYTPMEILSLWPVWALFLWGGAGFLWKRKLHKQLISDFTPKYPHPNERVLTK